MRKVVIESPYAGTPEQIDRNLRYLRACMRDCLMRGEAPIASHLIYTQPGILDDCKTFERKLGIAAGFVWAEVGDLRAVYVDLGITKGMQEGINHAIGIGQFVETRTLKGKW